MNRLFSEFNLKDFKIKNRIVMPPMVCFGWTDNKGLVTEDHIRHYEARARGGVGLIILEAICVNAAGRLADSQLGIWSDEHIAGLSQIADRCHKHGAVVIAQIHHAGLKTPKTVSEEALAPSGYSEDGKTARALTVEEIYSIQQDFVDAARRAKKAGLDGIELHGAHGYLISQFMSPLTNRREDGYGGNISSRMRFACEIIDMIKMEAGDDFILGYRMGGNEPTLENGIHIAKELEKRGIDLLHVSAGISSDKLPKTPEGFKFNWIVYCGTEIKKHVRIPVIVVNGIRTPQQAAQLIENNMADFTAIGRGLLADPEWVNKAREDSSIDFCMECRRCQWFTDGKRCPRNR